jgi:hypothetical protein
LFSEKPYICLQENSWNSDTATASVRYFIIDAGTGRVIPHAASYQAYTDAEYRSLLAECGFPNAIHYDSLPGNTEKHQRDFIVFVATE